MKPSRTFIRIGGRFRASRSVAITRCTTSVLDNGGGEHCACSRPRQRHLFEPRNEADNERGERGDNVGEQLLPRSHQRAACCFSPCQIERASRSLTCRMPRLLNSRRQARHSRQVAILARHCACSVCQCRKSSLAVKGDVGRRVSPSSRWTRPAFARPSCR